MHRSGKAAADWLSLLRGRLTTTRRTRLILIAGAAAVVAAIAAGGVLLYQATHQSKQITAYFAESIGVYQGSTVRVLGVPVGTVDSIQPQGTRVKVTMTINHGVAVPAGVEAVVIAPSVVSDRYIQLTPAFTGGRQIADGAVIPVSRTAVPVEIDQVYASLAKLLNALGPAGANRNGALSNLIKTGAANLDGNGGYLRAMITQFSGLSKTLGGSANNLFATLAYLQQFTTMLKNNDGQVRLAEQQLAQISAILAGDRQNLSAVIRELAVALGQVKGFIGANRGLIQSNVSKLATITSILVRERASLAQALDVAPLAADNFVNAYDATTHTLDGRGYLAELIHGRAGTGAFTTAATWPGTMLPPGSIAVSPADVGRLPPLPLPAAGTVYASPQALLRGGS
jgi:phospholipid/cholesterol/gamma-HCH transport system substrate-binding protein